MHLSWLGLSSFKIETKEAVLVTDPFSPKVSQKPLRAKADIVTVTDPESSTANHLDGIQGEPFVIENSGEFELKGIFVQGLPIKNQNGEITSTLFLYDLEGIRLAHMGNLSVMPDSDTLEKMDGVDVLFLAVGGAKMDLKQSMKVFNEIEPRIVVPMEYEQKGVNIGTKLSPVSAFLKEMGATGVKPVDKMIFKKKDLPNEEDTQVVLFTV